MFISAKVFPTGRFSWHRSAFDKTAFCQCIGAADMVPGYEFEFCSIRDMTLEQWVELCNAKNICEEGDFEVIIN